MNRLSMRVVRLGLGGVLAAALSVSAAASESENFARYLDQVYEQKTEASPIQATGFGLKTGHDRWDDLSPEAQAAAVATVRDNLAHVREAVDYDALDARAKLQYRVFVDEQELLLERHRWRNHLYPLNQIVGLHVEVPGILINQHRIDDLEDAEAYISRLQTVDRLFAQLVANMKAQADAGFYMPKSVYPLLIAGAERVISGAPFDDGADNPIWADFNRRIALLDLPAAEKERLAAEARAALTGSFREAYQDLAALLQAQAKRTTVDGGVWQLPDGDAFYAFLVGQFTTTDMTPQEIHELGLREAKRIRGEMRDIMRQVGFEGSLRDFMESLKTDPRFYYENTDEGRTAYLERARKTVAAIRARITETFLAPPAIPLEVRRFEPYREKTSPTGFYEAGSPDGRRPGAIYLNLSDLTRTATYDLEALLYHEGIPGHHMQISTILTDPGIPELRKVNQWWLNSAFVEGWALYAEHLAKDMGFYRDPYADFGRLAGELWRAYRLVVDSGLHYKRWSRQQAIDFLNENTSNSNEANTRAVDRYLAVPGQATSFMVGMKKFLELREDARKDLGEDFDIREFHDVVLRNGFIPLWAAEEAVDHWVAEKR